MKARLIAIATVLCLGVTAAQPPEVPTSVRGELIRLYLDVREFVVADFGGRDVHFTIAPDCNVVVAGKPAGVEQLREFMNVQVDYRNVGSDLIATSIKDMGRVLFHRSTPEASPDSENVAAVVKVYYATDRAPFGGAATWPVSGRTIASIASLAITLATMGLFRLRKRRALNVLTLLGWMLTAVLAYVAVDAGHKATGGPVQEDRLFSGGRGSAMQYGTCAVSIPREHQLGRLESPSLLRFEFRFDPEKHVTLQSVDPLSEDGFHDELRAAVARTARKELLLFVHGYNVAFAEAVRRTAQLSYDLEFRGPTVLFSWPSQAGLAEYTVDESNVEWAGPDLADLLRAVAKRSGARSLQLIAHSMGNRAMTAALRTLATDPEFKPALVREVVFAAPDVDATVFRRDLFPAIRGTARRLTLYASSNDRALTASKTVHGYPRAGDSGENLLVVAGLDTVDVSAVDTSLLGHSYYGDNRSIVTDLHHLISRGEPPQKRTWLTPAERQSLPYWVFRALRPL